MNIYEQYGRLVEEYARATEQLELTQSVLLKLKSGELAIENLNFTPPPAAPNGVVESGPLEKAPAVISPATGGEPSPP
jgi:hypothetical protein